jgi:hypothetical protein
MPWVRLNRRRLRQAQLPPVCLCCGQPTEDYHDQTFSTDPGWVTVLIVLGICAWPLLLAGLIALVAARRRVEVPVPLCPAHTGYWTWRTLFLVIPFIIFVLCALAGGVWWAFLTEPLKPAWYAKFGMHLTLASAAALFVWLFAAAIIQSRTIRASAITPDEVTLTNVARRFVDRYEGGRTPEPA